MLKVLIAFFVNSKFNVLIAFYFFVNWEISVTIIGVDESQGRVFIAIVNQNHSQ